MTRAVAINAMFSALLLLTSPASAVLSVGMMDTFHDGTTNGWTSGLFNPNAPSNAPNGGPDGAGDRFLLLTANGQQFVSGGKLVAFSGPQWAGNYISAGVTGIRMDVNNLGATDLSLRLYFEGLLGAAFSTNAVAVSAGSGWIPIVFAVEPAALTSNGTVAVSDVVQNVLQVRLLHSVVPALLPSPVGTFAPEIVAQLGIDNISAVPEPSTWITMGLGLAVLLMNRAGRRYRLSTRRQAL